MGLMKKIEHFKLFIFNVTTRFLCLVGIHQWKDDIVYGKKKFEHCIGYEEINDDKNSKWHIHGRSCKNCPKEQYFYTNWLMCGWQDVL